MFVANICHSAFLECSSGGLSYDGLESSFFSSERVLRCTMFERLNRIQDHKLQEPAIGDYRSYAML